MKYNCVSWVQPLSHEKRKEININMGTEPFAVLCLNLKGDANLGNIMRTACLMGCKNFYIAGRKKWDKRYSVGAHHYMSVHHLDNLYHTLIDTHHTLDCDCGVCKCVNIQNFIEFIRHTNMVPIFIEQGGMCVLDKSWKCHDNNKRILFVFGNETNGIPQQVMREIQKHVSETRIVSIPQMGVMRSHNVATSCTIILWEYMRDKMSHVFQLV